ncbi:hypothetical protein DNTS_007841 [Danionella cerebrum]|uniref:Lysosome-associated membrane glycoprotein 2-like luminal domain-containing protein n=1 Tax=Danionella cerebrum TaxID=2873325 RepID=A0A553N3H2_9TELE|nr:hypothetical protein DNTS_010969 [Danionella translucida]TRY96254.1 hypothetical protein DNTS_032528 [Danionella translucida]TRZ01115.1 hypothetical protein DNTS_007841 [Danionella translucida]
MSHFSHHLLLVFSLHWLGSALATESLDVSDSPSSNQSVTPVLQPKESTPSQFSYTVQNLKGQVCIRASLGVEFVVKENKKKYYFNLKPDLTRATGYCGNQKSVLSLEFDDGHLEFTFIKDGDVSYVKTIKCLLKPTLSCKNCQSKQYAGIVNNHKLFQAKTGQSFMCKSETTLIMADNLKIKLLPMQIQAFDLVRGVFGKELECWADFNRSLIPIILGSVATAICLIAILTYVLLREHRSQGYEQL